MSERVQWIAVSLVSMACLVVIVMSWRSEVTNYQPRGAQLTTDQDVSAALNEYLQRSRSPDNPVLVPTGVFLQSVKFVSSSDINFTGVVWQKYADNINPDITRGFLVPEQVDSSSTVIQELYRRKVAGYEVIGWYVDVTVREHFDYTSYPLDRHDAWLRLWHADFDRKVLLVPDLASYDSVEESRTFGIDRAITPGGWTIEDTWFSYRPIRYDTNFGIADFVGKRGFPELHFHVVVSRNFVDAFVVNLIPLVVIAALLFAILMSMSTDEEQSDRFGFDMFASLGAASALLFTVILAHIQLREEFPGSHVSYMECYYLIMYLLILLVGLNGYMFTFLGHREIPQTYHSGIKLAYWPLLLGTLAVVTVVIL